uniref:Uncharacterized protein n=1 Tax=Anguilla anguilla TaxID=7936 RepID=A0A0E9Q3X2_ANGAN
MMFNVRNTIHNFIIKCFMTIKLNVYVLLYKIRLK